jgi:hypothetical protein
MVNRVGGTAPADASHGRRTTVGSEQLAAQRVTFRVEDAGRMGTSTP